MFKKKVNKVITDPTDTKISYQYTEELINNHQALVKTIASNINSPEGWMFFINQYKDPKNIRPIKNPEEKYLSSTFYNAATQHEETRLSRLRGQPKPDATHIKKTATSLLPPDGKMTLYKDKHYTSGLVFDIKKCVIKNKFIFAKNMMTNKRWHIPTNPEYTYIVLQKTHKATTLNAIRKQQLSKIQKNEVPEWNEIVAKTSKESISAVFCIRDYQHDQFVADRVVAIYNKYRIKQFLLHDVPLVIINNTNKFSKYTIPQQVDDIINGLKRHYYKPADSGYMGYQITKNLPFNLIFENDNALGIALTKAIDSKEINIAATPECDIFYNLYKGNFFEALEILSRCSVSANKVADWVLRSNPDRFLESKKLNQEVKKIIVYKKIDPIKNAIIFLQVIKINDYTIAFNLLNNNINMDLSILSRAMPLLVRTKRLRLIEKLCLLGVDVDYTDLTSKNDVTGKNALEIAVDNNSVNIVECILFNKTPDCSKNLSNKLVRDALQLIIKSPKENVHNIKLRAHTYLNYFHTTKDGNNNNLLQMILINKKQAKFDDLFDIISQSHNIHELLFNRNSDDECALGMIRKLFPAQNTKKLLASLKLTKHSKQQDFEDIIINLIPDTNLITFFLEEHGSSVPDPVKLSIFIFNTNPIQQHSSVASLSHSLFSSIIDLDDYKVILQPLFNIIKMFKKNHICELIEVENFSYLFFILDHYPDMVKSSSIFVILNHLISSQDLYFLKKYLNQYQTVINNPRSGDTHLFDTLIKQVNEGKASHIASTEILKALISNGLHFKNAKNAGNDFFSQLVNIKNVDFITTFIEEYKNPLSNFQVSELIRSIIALNRLEFLPTLLNKLNTFSAYDILSNIDFLENIITLTHDKQTILMVIKKLLECGYLFLNQHYSFLRMIADREIFREIIQLISPPVDINLLRTTLAETSPQHTLWLCSDPEIKFSPQELLNTVEIAYQNKQHSKELFQYFLEHTHNHPLSRKLFRMMLVREDLKTLKLFFTPNNKPKSINQAVILRHGGAFTHQFLFICAKDPDLACKLLASSWVVCTSLILTDSSNFYQIAETIICETQAKQVISDFLNRNLLSKEAKPNFINIDPHTKIAEVTLKLLSIAIRKQTADIVFYLLSRISWPISLEQLQSGIVFINRESKFETTQILPFFNLLPEEKMKNSGTAIILELIKTSTSIPRLINLIDTINEDQSSVINFMKTGIKQSPLPKDTPLTNDWKQILKSAKDKLIALSINSALLEQKTIQQTVTFLKKPVSTSIFVSFFSPRYAYDASIKKAAHKAELFLKNIEQKERGNKNASLSEHDPARRRLQHWKVLSV